MTRRKISNELWAALEPLIPVFTASPKGGRRRAIEDRAALSGILFVLQTGIPWEDLPQELGFGSGMTCWRRLRDWQAAGMWDKLHRAMLRRLREHDQIDWGRASVDAASAPSPRGARKPAPTQRTAANSGRNDTSS
jgi:transposase